MGRGMLLAIDTATKVASIALYGESEVRSEHSWLSYDSHTVELMPNLVRMLKGQGMGLEELAGIAVSLGPGSFTGIRIGMSVAKGLSLALELPIVGIPSLDALGYGQAYQDLAICAIIRAGRGRICAATYRRGTEPWGPLGEYRLTTIEELCEDIEERTLFCGEMDTQAISILRQNLGERAVIASPAFSLRRAGYLAELGWRRLERGERDDPATLAPIYLHYPVSS